MTIDLPMLARCGPPGADPTFKWSAQLLALAEGYALPVTR
jgi:hypothetical protein